MNNVEGDLLGHNVRVIVTGTRFLGGMKLANRGKGKVETGLNIDE
jgi:hypothetical protein